MYEVVKISSYPKADQSVEVQTRHTFLKSLENTFLFGAALIGLISLRFLHVRVRIFGVECPVHRKQFGKVHPIYSSSVFTEDRWLNCTTLALSW